MLKKLTLTSADAKSGDDVVLARVVEGTIFDLAVGFWRTEPETDNDYRQALQLCEPRWKSLGLAEGPELDALGAAMSRGRNKNGYWGFQGGQGFRPTHWMPKPEIE
jgi:hypothetical protein